MCKEYKYNIYYILHGMEQEERNKALQELPKTCGVTKETFRNWIYIKKDNPREIYQSCLLIIAKYLKVNFVQLFNIEENVSVE